MRSASLAIAFLLCGCQTREQHPDLRPIATHALSDLRQLFNLGECQTIFERFKVFHARADDWRTSCDAARQKLGDWNDLLAQTFSELKPGEDLVYMNATAVFTAGVYHLEIAWSMHDAPRVTLLWLTLMRDGQVISLPRLEMPSRPSTDPPLRHRRSPSPPVVS